MSKFKLLLLLVPLFFAIGSCKKKDENNLTPEQKQEAKLIANVWKATGVYLSGAATPAQTPKLTLEFKDGNGSVTTTDNTVNINSTAPLATQWSINADATKLSMKIPDPKVILGAETTVDQIVAAVLSASTTDLKITLSDTELVIFGESGKSINIFGIPLVAGAELRFNKTGSSEAPTNTMLTAVTWKGEGIYTKDVNDNYIKSDTDVSSNTMKFGTSVLGFKTVEFSGITVPVTWSIDKAENPTKLTMIFPKTDDKEARVVELNINKLTATNLDFEATNDVDIIITTLSVNNQLKMIPK